MYVPEYKKKRTKLEPVIHHFNKNYVNLSNMTKKFKRSFIGKRNSFYSELPEEFINNEGNKVLVKRNHNLPPEPNIGGNI